ncbi:hypothetical protein [Spirosoma pollinicola]|nr:hypothetical protein [Spirosoma pollinicola]
MDLVLLAIVPHILWTLWVRVIADYRTLTLPYLWVLLALGLRIINSGG